jgi:CheY-like chemotaxis protein
MTIDHQRAVSELLRSADKAIKDGNLDSALSAISKVFEFDQRNVYARAYQERILSLKEMQLAARATTDKIPSDAAKKVQETEFAQPKSVPPVVKDASPAIPHPGTSAPMGTAAAPTPDSPQVHTQQKQSVFIPLPESGPSAAPAPVATAPQPIPAVPSSQPTPRHEAASGTPSRSFEFVKESPARLEAYRTLLADFWTIGMLTEFDEQRIAAIRQSFGITDEEHASIESDIRFASYFAAIERAWKKGVTGFDELRKQFRITDQEQLQIEGRVFRLLQSLRSVGTTLLIDDDAEFLQIVNRQLTEAGYYCVTVPTCEEALLVLESLSPDVIVCDVNFSKPNMSGFAFYEKFRAMEKFFHVPFIFLSGMVQEAVQRTGMQMGADSYFTKPIDLELFLATIEGKIKRSSDLQQRLSPHRL